MKPRFEEKSHFSEKMSVFGALFPASKQTNLFHLISSSVLPFFGFPVRPSAKILDSHRSFHRRFPSLREGGRHSRGTRPEMDKSSEFCILETLAAAPAGVGTDAAASSRGAEHAHTVGTESARASRSRRRPPLATTERQGPSARVKKPRERRDRRDDRRHPRRERSERPRKVDAAQLVARKHRGDAGAVEEPARGASGKVGADALSANAAEGAKGACEGGERKRARRWTVF